MGAWFSSIFSFDVYYPLNKQRAIQNCPIGRSFNFLKYITKCPDFIFWPNFKQPDWWIFGYLYFRKRLILYFWNFSLAVPFAAFYLLYFNRSLSLTFSWYPLTKKAFDRLNVDKKLVRFELLKIDSLKMMILRKRFFISTLKPVPKSSE